MQLWVPDARYTTSAGARTSFRLALKLALGFVALLWAVHMVSWALGLDLQRYGIVPRHLAGLWGVLFAPLLHADVAHLMSNSMPMLVLGTGILYLYPAAAFRIVTVVYLGTGLVVWVVARPALHIGASGLVYGFVAYIFVAGFIRRDVRSIAASLLVYFLYGTLAWGVLPIKAGVSWESHLAGALVGVALAIGFRRTDVPPRKRYDWEDEEDEDEEKERV